MSLKEYKQKRDLKTGLEPPGNISKHHKDLAFVVQKHAASHLHYDFRLELDGVLKSWAVPKGPSLNPGDKRLAIMVEDHPYDYRTFEGIISPGNYGAGTVMVWDEGTYQPLDKKGVKAYEKAIREGLKKGEITFELQGKKLKGKYTLVKLKKSDPDDKSWLLIKAKDPYASKEDVTELDRSVVTKRTMDQISANADPDDPDSPAIDVDSEKGSKAKMPKWIKPMLAYAVDEPFDSDEHIFEVKWDGFRALARVEKHKVELYSRSFQSFNKRFAPIAEALKQFPESVLLDGEIVIIDEKGRSSFQDLQNYQRTGEGNLCYYVFDILFYQGIDLRTRPLIERKALLKQFLTSWKNHPLIRYSDHILSRGKELYALAKKQSLEGVVAKAINSEYVSSRSKNWLKIKTKNQQEVIICGFTSPKGSRKGFGSLILGVFEKEDLKYVGHVGTGFDEATLQDLMKKMSPLITTESPFSTSPKEKSVTWIKPKLVSEVAFAEWTKEGIMRHSVYLGLRDDKDPKEVKMEATLPTKTIKKISKESKTREENSKSSIKVKKSSSKGSSKKSKSKESEVAFTNLDKVFWPVEGYTKGDLIEYYRKMSPYILPYLTDRPESLRRYPNGIEQEGFFQKNVDHSLPNWIQTTPVLHDGKSIDYMVIQDLQSLLFAINLGCIDLNPFNSRIQSLDYPDYMVLDLDPVEVGFDQVVEVALATHEILEDLDVPNFCKTSGSRGLHIYVPMGAKYTYEQTKEFAHLIAQLVNNQLPEITSLERSPDKRTKKVYPDYLQNNFGQTLAAPYSIRPKKGAKVSTPLLWSEVKRGLDPNDFTIKTIFSRLKELKNKDLFLPVLGKGIDLRAVLKKVKR